MFTSPIDEETHKRLDSELKQLLPFIICSTQRRHTAAKSRVLHILASIEGKLIPLNWRKTGLCPFRVSIRTGREALYGALTAMSSYVTDPTTKLELEDENAQRVAERVIYYLFLRRHHLAASAKPAKQIDSADTGQLPAASANPAKQIDSADTGQLPAASANPTKQIGSAGTGQLPAASAKPAKQIGSAGTGQLPTTSGRQKRRRRTNPRKPRPLTPKESEAVHLVGEHKGKVAAAAKVAGKSRQAMQKLYDKAMKKLGKSVFRHATQAIPSDLRGQSTIPDERN